MLGPGLVIDDEQAVEGPAGPIPRRRDRSVRRTATMDMLWPEGPTGPLQLQGRARDALTISASSAPKVVRAAEMDARLRDRVIEEIIVTPETKGITNLVGQRGGGHLRSALAELVPEVRTEGSPLYLLLDDISGTSLIGGVAWIRQPGAAERMKERGGPPPTSSMEGVCIGFAPGSSSLTELAQFTGPPRVRPVGELGDPEDPHGWHDLPVLPKVSTRRARFIDVHLPDDRTAVIESGFQDSAGDPDHGRVGIHEYRLRATADLATQQLTSIDATPHILPFRECPSAVASAQKLVGAPLSDLREVVLERLARTNGCTHLNDALRALAEVPVLIRELEDLGAD